MSPYRKQLAKIYNRIMQIVTSCVDNYIEYYNYIDDLLDNNRYPALKDVFSICFKTNITNASWSACPGASPSNQYGSYLYTYWTPFIPFAIYTTTTTSDVIKMQASYSGGGPSGGGIFVMTGWIGALRVK